MKKMGMIETILLSVSIGVIHLVLFEWFLFKLLLKEYNFYRRIYNNMIPQSLLENEKIVLQKLINEGLIVAAKWFIRLLSFYPFYYHHLKNIWLRRIFSWVFYFFEWINWKISWQFKQKWCFSFSIFILIYSIKYLDKIIWQFLIKKSMNHH